MASWVCSTRKPREIAAIASCRFDQQNNERLRERKQTNENDPQIPEARFQPDSLSEGCGPACLGSPTYSCPKHRAPIKISCGCAANARINYLHDRSLKSWELGPTMGDAGLRLRGSRSWEKNAVVIKKLSRLCLAQYLLYWTCMHAYTRTAHKTAVCSQLNPLSPWLHGFCALVLRAFYAALRKAPASKLLDLHTISRFTSSLTPQTIPPSFHSLCPAMLRLSL